MGDLRYFFSVEIQFAVLVAEWMKLALLDHPQHCPTPAMEQLRYILDGGAEARRWKWIRRMEAGIEQERQPVLEGRDFPTCFAGRHFRKKINW